MNQLVGEKVSIVTAKPQTTRQRVIGVYSDDDVQALFVDAPGAIKSTSGINNFLRKELDDVIEKSDVLVAVLNIDEKDPKQLDEIVSMTSESGKPWVALITKMDLPQRHRVGILEDKLKKFNVPVLHTSIKYTAKEMRTEIIPKLIEILPEAQGPLFDPEIYTTQNMRELASEVIREKCFEFLHQEVPYGLAVKVLRFIEDEGPVVKIHAEIVVSRDGHRAIVVGTGAKALKMIGMAARKDLEAAMDRQIYLDLHVKVRKNWMKQDNMMKDFGYVVTEK